MTTPETNNKVDVKVNDIGEITQAVWSYMTSVKSVTKRNGEEQAFDREKLLA